MNARLLTLLLWGSTSAAAPASASLLRVVYPGFEASGYRADGRRIGWTQVQTWPARPGSQLLVVEKLEGEGSGSPSELELLLLDGAASPPKVLARYVGWRGHRSTESCSGTCAQRLVGLDLGDFAFCTDEVALGVVTESARGPGIRLRELELFRVHEGRLVPIAKLPQKEISADGKPVVWKLTLIARRGEACRDLLVQASAPATRRLFRWNGETYDEIGESPAAR